MVSYVINGYDPIERISHPDKSLYQTFVLDVAKNDNF